MEKEKLDYLQKIKSIVHLIQVGDFKQARELFEKLIRERKEVTHSNEFIELTFTVDDLLKKNPEVSVDDVLEKLNKLLYKYKDTH